jgi:hypothetical protein
LSLRDHCRPPLDDLRHWEGFHATRPVMIVALLCRNLSGQVENATYRRIAHAD